MDMHKNVWDRTCINIKQKKTKKLDDRQTVGVRTD